ncbi:hypothetical protein [Mycobacteroides immunogenum]|uniref:Uncharacterized protein n=1 Tax=Mycobacteroides immunogenum TaxID=83262 RepID=A0A7V8RUR8_9MYCO|nr:hypothetical protein [Mycobacteroides immunogenum]AMT72168.1 hypothetical protein ABG82_19585 [Mycobacteroides immunogenum]ANO05299.1 hypothetical protein BAB75_19840 [Mycobacteroides immunogenum]KIU37970.1 hypothetical protein TL11_24690 [Mycobacteroides immunogenum]KPG04188.1 hypothetical protein AN909_23180 [Mycobacteroides immunogenum]KPG04893.1 hypothetical protein AN908_24030 [Mycobacteroides immunogenum]
MGLISLPTAVLSDADIADALSRAVRVINPVLAVLAQSDPFGLKERTYELGAGDGVVDKALDALACALNTATTPGTKAWDRLDTRGKAHWWVQRVGAVNTVFVAFPGVFGALARRLPVQDLLGFSNQAIVLVAIARELGIDDHRDQVRLLAKVLCDRTLSDEALASAADDEAPETPRSWSPFAMARTLWHLAGILRAVGAELQKRPQPKPIFRYLGMLPAVGGLAGYFGEYGALRRAASAGERSIAARSQPVHA